MRKFLFTLSFVSFAPLAFANSLLGKWQMLSCDGETQEQLDQISAAGMAIGVGFDTAQNAAILLLANGQENVVSTGTYSFDPSQGFLVLNLKNEETGEIESSSFTVGFTGPSSLSTRDAATQETCSWTKL